MCHRCLVENQNKWVRHIWNSWYKYLNHLLTPTYRRHSPRCSSHRNDMKPLLFTLIRVLWRICEIKAKHNTLSFHQRRPAAGFLLSTPRKRGRVQACETSKRRCLPLKWLPRLTNWLNLSTLRAFNAHNYCQRFSTNDKMEFMIERDNALEAGSSATIWLCHFDRGLFDGFVLRPASANHPPPASTNKERPKGARERSVSLPFIPLAASFSLSLHTFQLGD